MSIAQELALTFMAISLLMLCITIGMVIAHLIYMDLTPRQPKVSKPIKAKPEYEFGDNLFFGREERLRRNKLHPIKELELEAFDLPQPEPLKRNEMRNSEIRLRERGYL